jgi:predicted extracellular nuclease
VKTASSLLSSKIPAFAILVATLLLALPVTAFATVTLSINDVTQDEGNAGTTTFTFAVSLSAAAPAGGVSFTWSTANGTTNPATSGTDYTAVTNQSASIPQGSTTAVLNVNVNGDTAVEPNETFFINISNVTGATVTDGQGLGTITNDDFVITPIYVIQGSGTTSPFNGANVTTTGLVTGFRSGTSGGFFLQDPSGDGNSNTSDGIFVSTGASLPADAVVGNLVRVAANVTEFVPSSDPNQNSVTQLSGVSSVIVLSTGNGLLAATTIPMADTTVASLNNLEKYEGMRVSVPSLTVIAPTAATINEATATATSTGVFFGVVTGVDRPFREAGIPISDPVPAPSPANVPRFDENPERLRVESAAQPGATALNVASGAVLSNVTGPLDYSSRTYTILTEPTNPPNVDSPGLSTPVAAPTPVASEFTVASMNLQGLFNTADDPPISEPVLTTNAFDRRMAKLSLVIRSVMRSPDVIGVEEVEDLATLQALAAKVNSDASTPGDYRAELFEGNDPAGLDVGFLVRTSRVVVFSVAQLGKTDTYLNPNNGQQATLYDHPPLLLRARSGAVNFSVIVNHLVSPAGIGDATVGPRVRAQRRAQAEALASLIQSRQTADPTEKIITVGDMNALRVNDGYVDVVGTIIGTPAPANQVVLASADLVNPNQTDVVDSLAATQRYSVTANGNAQVLDHVIVNPNVLAILTRAAFGRANADQPGVDLNNGAIADRASERDQPIAYFTLPTSANDTDGDGMSNDYEDANGLNSNINDAAGDLDGDGALNLDESVAGTNANNPKSIFRVRAITLSGGMMQLTWNSVAGKTYRVLGCPSPTGDYQIVVANIASQGNDSTSTTFSFSDKRFFRVEVQ